MSLCQGTQLSKLKSHSQSYAAALLHAYCQKTTRQHHGGMGLPEFRSSGVAFRCSSAYLESLWEAPLNCHLEHCFHAVCPALIPGTVAIGGPYIVLLESLAVFAVYRSMIDIILQVCKCANRVEEQLQQHKNSV